MPKYFIGLLKLISSSVEIMTLFIACEVTHKHKEYPISEGYRNIEVQNRFWNTFAYVNSRG